MLQKFSAEDAAVAGPSARIPQWSMKMPGIGSKALVSSFAVPLQIALTGHRSTL